MRFILPGMLVVSLCGVNPAAAQPASRLEIGVQADFLRLSDFATTNAGLGGRVSFDVARWLAVQGEASFFPKDDVLLPSSSLTPDLRVIYRRRRIDESFGAQIGLRRDRIGVFGTVRPGFTRLLDNGGPDCVGRDCALVLLVRPVYRTEFALNMGGVFEFYPSARTVARVELGDAMIRHRSTPPPCLRCTSHNLASRVGVGFRF